MQAVIQALVVSTMIQLIAMFAMSAYIFDKSTDQASRLVLQHRNEVQQQFADEREQMKLYVDKRIDLKLSQALPKK
ncbi:hypothetical protein [Pseudomonas sp. GW101-3H06]|uniref:hypothetical protein n=1 Tax=Pseudomonas sp. GW101-3H06 TaxID=2751347 RepID=UPI001A91DF11|nr:hypothetical protein [Pseudomonas sp. GW101-3H06]